MYKRQDAVSLGSGNAISEATVDFVKIDGTYIGHINDEDLITLGAGEVTVAGDVNATKFYGDGSNLTGISVGITTEALTTAGATVTLDLSKDDHKITKSGTYTITCTGGAEASAHTLRIVNSGISTVGFSTVSYTHLTLPTTPYV